jgi:hypothetical protein
MHMAADNQQIMFKKIQEELAHAEFARAQGNEGMARVCSRRAAGIATGMYLSLHGITGFGSSVHERLNILKTLTNISPQAIDTAEHLLLRVNEDHELPNDVDLIEETRWLIYYLLPNIEKQ